MSPAVEPVELLVGDVHNCKPCMLREPAGLVADLQLCAMAATYLV